MVLFLIGSVVGASIAYFLAQTPTNNSQVSKASTCPATTEKEIAGLFDRWNTSLQTGDPEKVLANYSPSAILLATLANKPRTTPEELKEYFTSFLLKKPFGTINTRKIALDCNTASDFGTYTFDLVLDGKKTKVPARYSFEYGYKDGEWKIIHQHSSGMPEK